MTKSVKKQKWRSGKHWMRASSVVARWSGDAIISSSLLTFGRSKINIILDFTESQSSHIKDAWRFAVTLSNSLITSPTFDLARQFRAAKSRNIYNVKFLRWNSFTARRSCKLILIKTSPSTGKHERILSKVYLTRLQIDFRFRETLDYTAG